MRKPGFTFVELLLALTLFSVGFVGLLRVFPLNRRYLAQSASQTQAIFLAQEELEKVRADSYVNLTVMPAYYEPLENVGSSSSADPFNAYQRQTVVTLVDSAGGASATDIGLKKVQVTVSWIENGTTRSYVVSTYAVH